MNNTMSDKIATHQEVIKAIREDWTIHRGMKLVDVAQRLNMSRQSVSQLLKGKSRFRLGTANLLKTNFGYSLDYLLRGEGTLFDGKTEDKENSKKVTELNSAIAQKDAEITRLKQVIVEQAKLLTAKKIVIIVNPNPESDDAQ